jgi:beta-lactamase regulating signal transducer with metallopeptidase domain
MSALIDAVVTGAVVAGAGSLLLAGVSRLWRRRDAALWHALWVTLAVSSLVPFGIAPRLLHLVVAVPWANLPVVQIARPSTSVMQVAAWVYLGGAAWFAARLAIGYGLVRRLARQSRALEGLAAVHVGAIAPQAVSLCRIHPRVQVPLAIGWRRPIILLPALACWWPVERLSAVLNHELAHVRRRDYLWNLVAAVHRAVYWFSPGASLLFHRVRLLAELASDQRASEAVGRACYARQLLESIEAHVASGLVGILAPGASTSLMTRIQVLVAPQIVDRPLARSWRILLATGIALLVGLGMRTALIDPLAAPTNMRSDQRRPAFAHIGSNAHSSGHVGQHDHQPAGR